MSHTTTTTDHLLDPTVTDLDSLLLQDDSTGEDFFSTLVNDDIILDSNDNSAVNMEVLNQDVGLGTIHSSDFNKHTRSRPVPIHPNTAKNLANHSQQQQQSSVLNSQPNSHGSTGSGFMFSVLNRGHNNNTNNSIIMNNHHHNTPLLSHTPPVASSYEASHFGKRPRSGSVSSRVRSASEYLEEKGLLSDTQTRANLKDLIIIGDPELQSAIDQYESGDPSALEEMITTGALEKRLPKDLDILNDLDLDFLNVHDDDDDEIDDGHNNIDDNDMIEHFDSKPPATQSSASLPISLYSTTDSPQLVSPAGYDDDDDGIGDLDFNLVGEDLQSIGSVAASPASMSEYEKRMRSNSLFSALLSSESKPDRKKHEPEPVKSSKAQLKKLETQKLKEQKAKDRLEKKQRKLQEAGLKNKSDGEERVHVPGSGRPRSLSDPSLQTSIDEFGLMQVERPEGWVGAYSPDSRRVRIDNFMKKRNNRVWTKTVKYDVRKNFADSRLRVKGRFAKKEDELLMRELMSLT